MAGIDVNETAVFITKINLWLSCVRPGVSLPYLPKIKVDNTLKRFEKAQLSSDFSLSEFLDGLGARVVGIVSNPPWSMIEGKEHPEKWISDSNYWQSVKTRISSGKNNTAYNFAFICNEILSEDSVGAIILPGVYFVGSDAKIRDELNSSTFAYAPMKKNRDFLGVDPSQNFGIIGIQKNAKIKNKKLYLGIDDDKLKSRVVSGSIVNLPEIRKKYLPELNKNFKCNTILPLVSSSQELKVMEILTNRTKSILDWSKGNKNKSIKGADLKNFNTRKKKNTKGIYIATPENRGNSKTALTPVSLTEEEFKNCSHKVLKLQLLKGEDEQFDQLIDYYNSEEFNDVLNILRTSKSIQAATLNLLGIPTELAPLSIQLEALAVGEELKFKINKIRKKKQNSKAQ